MASEQFCKDAGNLEARKSGAKRRFRLFWIVGLRIRANENSKASKVTRRADVRDLADDAHHALCSNGEESRMGTAGNRIADKHFRLNRDKIKPAQKVVVS